jgi:putative copper resistance protein D
MENFLFLPKALAAALSDVTFAANFGLVIVSLWLQGDSEKRLHRDLRHRLNVCTAAMLLALIAQAYLLTATMIGSSAFAAVCGQFAGVMTGTHAGRVLLCNGCVILALIGLLLVQRGWQTRTQTWTLLAILVTLAAARAAIGHPAADGDFTLPEFAQFIHLISIATWAGGIITAGFFVLPALHRAEQDEAIVAFLRKLSRTVTVALVLVILSGIYNSYRGLDGSMAPLLRTQWGGLLDIKVFLVCIAVAMGASNRRMLRRSQGRSAQQISRLAVVLRVEASMMVLILLVSALLANSPPASSL